MIVLDAGVLIGFLDAADAHHDAAVLLLERARPPYFVHSLTLAEVLVGPAKRGVEDVVWSELSSIGVEVAALGQDESLLLSRLRAEHRLKMPDICVLATSQRLGADLVTFNHQLAAVAEQAGVLHSMPE